MTHRCLLRPHLRRPPAAPGAEEVTRGVEFSERGFEAVPRLRASLARELPEVIEEWCGLVAVVARYDGGNELFAAVDTMPSSRTASVPSTCRRTS